MVSLKSDFQLRYFLQSLQSYTQIIYFGTLTITIQLLGHGESYDRSLKVKAVFKLNHLKISHDATKELFLDATLKFTGLLLKLVCRYTTQIEMRNIYEDTVVISKES